MRLWESVVLMVSSGLAWPQTVLAEMEAQPFTEATFTVDEGSWMNVDVSPDGKTIMFDMLNDIYAIPSKGGEARLVHGGLASQHSPRFSSDGTRIAFISDESGADNVWISDADGSNERQVSHETFHLIMGPAWAADGKTIAASKIYSYFDTSKASEIRSYSVGGTSEHLVVETPPNKRDVQEARFSPDGRYLYYTERLNASYIYQDANHINFAVKRRDLDTGKDDTILRGFGSATTPQISPDGKIIAFVRRVGAKTVLFGYDLASREQWAVYDGLERDLHADFIAQEHYYPGFGWFPDSRHVAIWAKGKIKKIDMAEGSVEDVPFSVTASHEITDALRFRHDAAPAQFQARIIRYLAPAPNSETTVFRAVGKLWSVDGDDGAPTRLTASESTEYEPAWSRDGAQVAYVSWTDAVGARLILRSATDGAERILYETPGILREPGFSPDGESLVFHIEEPNKDMGGNRAAPGLYLTSVDGGTPVRIADSGEAPQFSPDGSRVLFVQVVSTAIGSKSVLRSVRLDGSDQRDLAISVDADTHHLRLSPDQRWLAFIERHNIYVVPFTASRNGPVTIKARGDERARRLTEDGGFDVSWAHDSSRVYWVLGPQRFEAAVAEDFAPKSKSEIRLMVESDAPKGIIAFKNSRILTMNDDDEVIREGTIVINGNRIVAVGPSNTVEPPKDALVFDMSGKTIMPGLFDAHGHIDCCYGSTPLPQQQPTRVAALAFGVTFNLDPYSAELNTYESAEMTLAGETLGPRWLGSGGAVYGRARKHDHQYEQIDSDEDALRAMRRKRALGATFIKSYKQPTRQRRQALVKAGRETGIMVDGEGESQYYVNVSMILDGHTNLEHNFPLANYYDDIVELFSASKTSNTPTLLVSYGELYGENYIYQKYKDLWKDEKVKTYIQSVTSGYSPLGTPHGGPPHSREMTTIHAADELYDIGVLSVSRSIKKLDDNGVLINAGSHGQQAGLALHWDMELLAEGGMAPMRILRAATINGARSYGYDHQVGSLEVGKLADIVVLGENPLEDIRNTNSVLYTMVNGRLYDAVTMNEIGHYNRPRLKFFWEADELSGQTDWNEAWGWE